jgi:hypothetical protein
MLERRSLFYAIDRALAELSGQTRPGHNRNRRRANARGIDRNTAVVFSEGLV